MKKAIITVLVFLLYAHGSYSQMPTVSIQNSQIQKITSSIVNQEYELQIFLPSGYENSSKKYPVVYLMDSQWDFPLVTSVYGQQYFDGFIPEVIIVGVTWAGVKPNPDSLRARDYTPTPEPRLPQSGGAPRFLSALEKEIIPFIEAKYKANSNDRILMGCSLGGLFTLYALFTQPQLFQRYVATTPAIGWDKEVIYQYEKAYYDKHAAIPARLYITMGEMERGLPGFEKLVKHLISRNYKSLQIKTRVLENTGHSGNKAEGYTRGLQYVFERPAIKLDPQLLNKYSGTYQGSSGNRIEIKVEQNGLVAYFGTDNKYRLNAGSESDFYATSEFLNIRFSKTPEGRTGLQMERYGSTQPFKKVE